MSELSSLEAAGCRLAHYPALDAFPVPPGALRYGAHVDSGGITVLALDPARTADVANFCNGYPNVELRYSVLDADAVVVEAPESVTSLAVAPCRGLFVQFDRIGHIDAASETNLAHHRAPVWKSNFGPHAIDARLPPFLRLLDGVT